MGIKFALAVLIILTLVVGLGAMIFFHRPMWLFYYRERHIANDIIGRVEQYQQKHQQLPETLRELGYEEPSERVFYFKLSDDEYCLSFGTELGQSETYRSHTRKWEEGRQCVADRGR